MLLLREKLFQHTSKFPDSLNSSEIEKDEQALAVICLHIEPHLFPYVKDARYAKDAWDSLAVIFEDKGVNRRISLLNSLLDEKLEKHSSMHEYVAAVMSHTHKLREIDHGIDDELVAVVLLRGLPDEFKPMRMALEHSGMKLTSENVRQKLLQEEKQCSSTISNNDSALATKGKKKLIQKPVKCFKCGEKGHKKPQCPQLAEQNNGRSAKKSLTTSLSVNDQFDSQCWYIDSGASNHMSFHKYWFRDIKVVNNINLDVTCANNDKISSAGYGDVMIRLNGEVLPIREVTYVPDLKVNLLSVSKMSERGWKICFDDERCTLIHESIGHNSSRLVATASKVSGIYKLDNCYPFVDEAFATVQPGNSMMLWHRRLGHVNEQDLRKLPGFDFGNKVLNPCVDCIKGKSHRLPFPVGESERAVDRLGLVHMDICGPMSVRSYGGARYMLVIVDDYTRKLFAYFLKCKSESLDYFKTFVTHVENETNFRLKCVRTDNGTEFLNQNFKEYLNNKGIKHQLTVPYTPEQNGVAERANRTIVEMARTMLGDRLNKMFWAEACNTAVYIKNRLPHRANKGNIPEELWTGKTVKFNHFRVFGSLAYVHIPKETRKKWDSKAKKYLFVGYCTETKAYRFADMGDPRIIKIARDVTFLEDTGDNHDMDLDQTVRKQQSVESDDSDSTVIWEVGKDVPAETVSIANPLPMTVPDESPFEDMANGDITTEVESNREDSEPRYPLRNRLRNQTCACITEDEPRTVQDAMNGVHKNDWIEAMNKEMQSMYENEVWQLVDRPPDAKVVGCKWIFKHKFDAEGNKSYKARLVAQGYSQSYGIDYFETFSPVVRKSTIRLLFSLAVHKKLLIDHFDVNTAFLNGNLQEIVYMKQPENFIENKNKVCLLKKAIYGLKQASRSWNEKINDVLLSMSFKRSDFDSCLYFGNNIYIALYVDDFLVLYDNPKKKKWLLENLEKKFKIKDLGTARQCLGMEITRNETGTLCVSQRKFIEKLLRDNGLVDCKAVKTPLEVDSHTNFAGGEGNGDLLDQQNKLRYQSLVGSLNYLACNTRPDISATVSFLSQYNSCCQQVHMRAAKRVLRYLKGTIDLNLEYKVHKSEFDICAYVDADWGGNVKDRKSFSGYYFKVGGNPISWECKKQTCVALSSTEAEYIALSEACKEATYLQSLLASLLGEPPKPAKLYVDNQSAVKLAINPVGHRRSKHIDIRFHFVRDCVQMCKVELEYVSTVDNIADIFTKPLGRIKFEKCASNLGIGWRT
jgi:transposase InsO family protein